MTRKESNARARAAPAGPADSVQKIVDVARRHHGAADKVRAVSREIGRNIGGDYEALEDPLAHP